MAGLDKRARLAKFCQACFRAGAIAAVTIVTVFGLSVGLWSGGAIAGLHDDDYDGNIFALYAGNGSDRTAQVHAAAVAKAK